MIFANDKRGLRGECIAGEVDGRELVVFRKVEALEFVVLQVDDFEIYAVAELNPVNICAFAIEVVD